MRKRKKSFKLLEALDFIDDTAPKGPKNGKLSETTWSRGYPDDGTGIAGDDDRPPGNIVYGEKYKREPFFNRLTTYQDHWKADLSDWKWDEFENSLGMEDYDNYSNTIESMKDLFPEEVWKKIWAKMKKVPDRLTTLRFKQAGQPWRTGKDQLGADKEDHVDINVDKDGAVKGADIKESSLEDKIGNFIM